MQDDPRNWGLGWKLLAIGLTLAAVWGIKVAAEALIAPLSDLALGLVVGLGMGFSIGFLAGRGELWPVLGGFFRGALILAAIAAVAVAADIILFPPHSP